MSEIYVIYISQYTPHQLTNCKQQQEAQGPYALLGHLLDKRMPVKFKLSSTNIPENLRQTKSRQNLENTKVPKVFGSMTNGFRDTQVPPNQN